TEDPELEIPVCKDLVKRYVPKANANNVIPAIDKVPYNPFNYQKRKSFAVSNIGGKNVPVVIADLSKIEGVIEPKHLQSVGYQYDAVTDKWAIGDLAADYVFTGNKTISFALPGTLKVITFPAQLVQGVDTHSHFPIFSSSEFHQSIYKSATLNFVMIDCFSDATWQQEWAAIEQLANNPTVVFCFSSAQKQAMPAVRSMFMKLLEHQIHNPVVLITDSHWQTADEHLIHFATETGALLLDGFGDGVCLGMNSESYLLQQQQSTNTQGRNYTDNSSVEQFINNTAFSILQATRTRISKTEYISCPSCGRTLFDLQETTARIRSVTNHLKGVKIAIMGCIVNGPGEMADADFGYVGSGVGKITLYKGKEVVKKNIDSAIAVYELINLLKENSAWVEPIA
ncbi:MAG: flavodoxin-dependent (E)-4-hydroxy-3-methylbut-2-enyl-diphosphate synthase, partial [Chitinophagaceae bacterium]